MFSSSAARSAFGPPVVLANRTRLRLTDKYEYPFVVQANDYNITFITGTGALCGMNAYNNASIPAAPTTAGAAANVGMFTMWFSLAGVFIQFFTTAGVAAGVSYNSAITNYAEYSNLFDEYKIDKVEVTMVYNNNNSSMNSPHVSAPVLLFVKDYDDNAFTSLAAMEQYSNFRAIQYGNSSGSNNGIQTITVKPKAQLFVETNSGSAVGMATTGWFDVKCSAATLWTQRVVFKYRRYSNRIIYRLYSSVY